MSEGIYQFGYSSAGNSIATLNNRIRIYPATPEYNGTLNEFWFRTYLSEWVSKESGTAAIFLSSNGALVAKADARITGTSTTKWCSVSLRPSSISAGTNYYLAIWGDSNPKYMGVQNNSDTYINYWYRDANFVNSGNGNFDYFNPLHKESFSEGSAGYDMLLYATYTLDDEVSGDLKIYYDNLDGTNYIDCNCSRWDVQNYDIVVETWMKKSDLQTLRSNITPGAVGELYTILGRPRYYDRTWDGSNTLMLSPNEDSSTSNLHRMRGKDKLIYVKNISDTPLPGESGWLSVKIEGMISGMGVL